LHKGSIYLIPNFITSDSDKSHLSTEVEKLIFHINIFIVENVRSARRFIRKIDREKNIDEILFFEYGKYNNLNFENDILKLILNGKSIGIISESGLPCVADPGAKIIESAHKFDIEVLPIPGPNSIILALISSGMNGQNFAFNGYLPINKKERKMKIIELEKKAKQENQTQIFIETPYRNNQVFTALLENCNLNTKLCIAMNITSKNQFIKTKSIFEWKNLKFNLTKIPCVFLIQ
tara:strand:- start:3108 stop:3812 length:705 start_codon:yes stop_codon:yes gene_type:complete